MAEISHGGLWIRWSSLKPRDKRSFAVSMGLLFVAGFGQGFLAGWFEDRPAGMTLENMLIALSPALPLLAASIIYLRFVLRQDELFRMFHIITSLWFVGGVLLVGIPGQLVNNLLDTDVVRLLHVLLAGAIGSVLGGFWASRRYL